MKRLMVVLVLCAAAVWNIPALQGDFEIENGVLVKYRGSAAEVVVLDRVTIIGDYAFSKCTGLASITLPVSLTAIGDWAFADCSGLASITIPDRVAMIGRGAFVRCTGLTAITLPAGSTFINRGLFGGCSGLESITIPENITEIGPVAFARCTSLKSVMLPENINAAYGAFSRCDSLDESVRTYLRERFGEDVFDNYGESY
ncbi:MAG: leucine-rich repeat domain-containing protein [Treponema sp.]|jgi:hypothetical protein|nr:leucine-rich repeat domain-containing protein [Treponema sp.]